MWFETLRRTITSSRQVSNFVAWQCPAAVPAIARYTAKNPSRLYTGDLLSYGYNYSNLGNDFPAFGAAMKATVASLENPAFTIVVSDSLSSRELNRGGNSGIFPGVLWGSVIAPTDYYGGQTGYSVADQHSKRANILFAEGSVRTYFATNVNAQVRRRNRDEYWWDGDGKPRRPRDSGYND